jgi:hypothetical protein
MFSAMRRPVEVVSAVFMRVLSRVANYGMDGFMEWSNWPIGGLLMTWLEPLIID